MSGVVGSVGAGIYPGRVKSFKKFKNFPLQVLDIQRPQILKKSQKDFFAFREQRVYFSVTEA